MYKSKPLYAAAVAVALTTSAIVPAAQTTVSAATHVKVKTVKLKSLTFTKGEPVKLRLHTREKKSHGVHTISTSSIVTKRFMAHMVRKSSQSK